MKSANKVFINTAILYGQMLLSMAIALYSSRVVLNVLGHMNYGIYNLIAGVIILLSFLNAAMTVSTQRYLSYYLGKGLKEKLQIVFNTSVILHLIIGIIISIILLVSSYFLFHYIINIPNESRADAILVYFTLVLSTFVSIITVPYDAILNSHENMMVVSIIQIIDSLSRLTIAVILIYYFDNKLISYSILIAVLAIVIAVIKRFYCRLKYFETKINLAKYFERKLFKEMFKFAGWNFFGAFSMLAKNQGLAIILNSFHGAKINASYAIANQVDAQLKNFSTYILKAINPQIAISEGRKDRDRMLKLSMIASKFAFLLLSFIAIPIIIEMPYILKIWLINVPPYAIEFCRFILIATMINLLSVGIQSAIQSVGIIKNYQIGISIILLLNIPIAFILLKINLSPPAVLFGVISIEVVAFLFRLLAAKRLTGMPIYEYLKYVVIKPLLIAAAVTTITATTSHYFKGDFIELITIIFQSSACYLLLLGFFGFSKYEKDKIVGIIKEIVGNISNRIKINLYCARQ